MGVQPRFYVGQIVSHEKFSYRGVIVDVDAVYQGTESWYEQVARSRPPKDRPWYRVLVDGAEYETYVAERHLTPDNSGRPIAHPAVKQFFINYTGACYIRQTH